MTKFNSGDRVCHTMAETENGRGGLWRYVDPDTGHTVYAWEVPSGRGGAGGG